jgi:hypothetical protein
MIFHTAFSQRWLRKLSTTSKKKINKEYLCFSLAPFQVLTLQTFSLLQKFVILIICPLQVFFFFSSLHHCMLRLFEPIISISLP